MSTTPDSADLKKAKQRLRYRKKTSSGGDAGTSAAPAPLATEEPANLAPPRGPKPGGTPRKSKNRSKAKAKGVDDDVDKNALAPTVLDADDITLIRRNREQQLNKQREYQRKHLEDEKRKREIRDRQHEAMVKRVEDETVNKLVRAEVMFTLLQEHKEKSKLHSTSQHVLHHPPRHDLDNSYPFGFNPTGVAPDLLLASIKRWEEHLKRLLGGTRVAEHERGIACLRQACRESYCELLLAHSETSTVLKLDLNERLWMSWYKEIDPLQGKLRGAAPHAGGHVSQHLRDAVTALLATCTAFYTNLLMRLTNASSSSNEVRRGHATTHSIHMTYVALGDVARYGQGLLPKASRSWRMAETQYHHALRYNPSNGKVYNQLALLALHQNQTLDAVYFYSRSLACATPFCARENLLTTLTTVKLPAAAIPFNSPEITTHCSAHLLHCFSRLFTSIDICKLEFEMPSAVDAWRRALATTAEHHRAFFMRTIALALFSVHNCQVPVGSTSLAPSVITDDPMFFQAEWPQWPNHDNVRYALQLVFLLTTALVEAVTASDLDESLLPALTLSLDWLRAHPWFLSHALSTKLREAMSRFLPLVHAKLRSDHRSDTWDGTSPALWDDVEVRGFLPLARVLRCQNEGETSTLDEMVVDVLSMRLVRIMGFVSTAVKMGWTEPYLPYKRVEKVAPQATTMKPSMTADCPQCSNSIAIDAGMCEFCGFETSFNTADDDGNDSAPMSNACPENKDAAPDSGRVRGILSGVQWQAPMQKQSAAMNKRHPFHRSHDTPARRQLQPVDFRGSGAAPADWKCLIVVDAANVAMRHGLNAKFSCRGIRLVIDHYIARGHKVIAFLPDYLLKYETVGAQKRMANVGYDVSPTKLPDDVTLLQAMVLEGLIIATPPQDYDDSYCIQYAGTHDGCVVTNDLFRDHLDNIKPSQKRSAMREWLKAHRISFTWVGDEFLPNPDFRFPPKRANDDDGLNADDYVQ
ncbi:hypothetical protein H310_06350 [Aphanomyces invadans]|uniref:RNase NYN domain-containing protein n=1 Tax=Aphanomyces invadans TaxID=157072 RepID=A0A024U5Q3_9STRA|nr:hypothetical protein H310_06350 [Aphanomyces invadans]ETW01746.1 hypothetical protein H310_06350 [Aphanomyces invadans]|eukprot:XP_008869594.1 hypothetical protein H310_06350 [Aphanomyces invadans]